MPFQNRGEDEAMQEIQVQICMLNIDQICYVYLRDEILNSPLSGEVVVTKGKKLYETTIYLLEGVTFTVVRRCLDKDMVFTLFMRNECAVPNIGCLPPLQSILHSPGGTRPVMIS